VSTGDARFEAVVTAAEAAAEEFEIPGFALGVLADGTEFLAGRGVTSVADPLPVEADTLFQIGSITKTFGATAVWRLVSEGELDLGVPVRTYLPELRLADEDVASRVTTRHLLTHTGGWAGDWFDDLGWGDDALARTVAQLERLPQLTPLGELFSYNNAGFYVLGRILEVVTGTTAEEAIAARVSRPFGLDRTFSFPWDVMTERFVVGHVEGADGPAVGRPWPVPRNAAAVGSIVSCVPNLLRYARTHMEDTTLAPMREPLVETGIDDERIGLAWFLRERDGVGFAGHGGATLGQLAELLFAPEEGFAVASLTNHQRGGALNLRVVAAALEQFLDVESPEPEPIELADEALAALAGRYESILTYVTLRPEDGRFVVEVESRGGFPKPDSPPLPSPPPSHAIVYAEDRVVVTDGPMAGARGRFVRADDGSIAWFQFGRRIHRPV
jgi:CubicO group peptidase (beta-lactamase class C family)